jgi:GNAT superfamily N-acetyltransferase
MTIRLNRPRTTAEWRDARRLIEAYAASLNVDLSFQNFAHELGHLPEEYGPPAGAFLLARDAGVPIGCVGLRRFSERAGEVKRLYVVPDARGCGVGRALAERIVATARQLGYARLLLDTLRSMSEAQALYMSLGFRPTAPYRYNPVPGTVFLELTFR